MTTYKHIEIVRHGKTAEVWLSRPQSRNAINREMLLELLDCLNSLAADSALHALLIRGRGPVFCAGADLKWMGQEDASDSEGPDQWLGKLFHALYRFPAPVIMVVHGRVMGGGMGIMACGDIILAEEDTLFCFPETRLGLIPATISPYIVQRSGKAAALSLMLFARDFSSEEALRCGLIDKRIREEFLEEHLEILRTTLQENAPLAMRSCKKLIHNLSGVPESEETRSYTAQMLKEIRTGREAREGVQAFLEKRKPNW